MEYIEFEKNINQLLTKYNIKSSNTTKRLYTYMECILEANNSINLTSITNPNEFIVKHFIDSLVISEYIDGNKILDIAISYILFKIEDENELAEKYLNLICKSEEVEKEQVLKALILAYVYIVDRYDKAMQKNIYDKIYELIKLEEA